MGQENQQKFDIIYVDKLDDFTFAVKELKKKFEERALNLGIDCSRMDIWYRGHAKRNYRLIPSLYRFLHGPEIEAELFKKYKNLNPHRDSAWNDWHILFEMQHYFIPTRLLDWTTRLEVAIYFAINAEDSDFPGVFLLNPFILNHKSFQLKDVKPLSIHDSKYNYQKDFIKDTYTNNSSINPIKIPYPIAIEPPYIFERLSAQEGKFTIHSDQVLPLEEICPEAIAKVEIRKSKPLEISEYIDITGITHRTIFPDLTGTAMFLRDKFGLKPYPEKRIISRLNSMWKHDYNEILKETKQSLHVQGIKGCIIDDLYIEREESSRLNSWLNNESKPFAVVTGQAASGKTNLLVNMIFKDEFFLKRQIVFYSLNNYEPHKHSLFTTIANFLNNIPPADPEPINENVLRQMIVDGRILLIIDGLDELARTQGESAVMSLDTELNRLLGDGNLKIVIACRDHIFQRLQDGKILKDEKKYELIKLNYLPKDEIVKKLRDRLKNDDIKKDFQVAPDALEIMSEIPLFYSALSHNIDEVAKELKEIKNKADFWNIWIKLSMESCGLKSTKDEILLEIGYIAAKMLAHRSDYLDDNELDSYVDLVNRFAKNKCPIFVKESNNKWRFIHQAIREYTLAWSMKIGLLNPKNESTLTETASFDYESAETYLYLIDLLPQGSIDPIVKDFGENLNCIPEKEKWNNLMRNYFEAVGMLGTKDEKILDMAIEQAKNVIAYPINGDGHRAFFKIKYNAARCLCRLHPSSPPEYCRFVFNYNWPQNHSSYRLVCGYAVRGFHMEHHKPGSRPPEVFYFEKLKHKRQEEICHFLINVLFDLLNYEELHSDGIFLRINVSHALIRWIEPQPETVKKIYELLNSDKLEREVKANLALAIYVSEVTDTKIKNVILPAPYPNSIEVDKEELKKMFG